jgi:hypothetical protein
VQATPQACREQNRLNSGGRSVRPTVTLGAIQFGDERNLTPVVCLDCPDQDQAQALARLLLSAEQGDRSMRPDDPTYSVGDIAIKVEVSAHPTTPKQAVIGAVWLRLRPTHLTEALYAANRIEADSATVFRLLQHTLRHFVLTVSVNAQPQLHLLYLMKYNLVWRSPLGAQ